MQTNPFWSERYRPQTIDQYVFHDETHKAAIMQMIANKDIPHLLLYGIHGSGKTTLARILIKAMEVDESDVLTINASDERGIDNVRSTIKFFADSMPFGRFKIIHLEEASALTTAAQESLKSLMEEKSAYVRFIFTVNHVNKLIPELRSRFQEFSFKASDIDDVTVYACKVLKAESVKFDLETVDRYVAQYYPDVRKIINTLQQSTIKGTLAPFTKAANAGAFKEKLTEALNAGNWNAARKVVCELVSPDEYVDVYRFLYANLQSFGNFKVRPAWEDGIVTIAEHLYKHTICADSEINLAALFIRLGQIK